ncbi:WapI family immunity protein [Litchfieldia salsa]|uniref:Uncharacterized protein n=1 Tax=Litchfieldia salsa TaxID=930152 RepID=A0A1H0TYA5_9BACI|nr:hypothetical protein [Litchfieldia salsa]SDP58919.1 hypothetical protein SAMN05216565_10422 [Litchfieldia salsa]
MEFNIIGEETRVVINILNRSHPECTDYWDGNWVKAKIDIQIPGYLAKFDLDLRTDELRDFLIGLRIMNKDLKGKAQLNNLDSYIEIECEVTKIGGIVWSVETCYPAGYGAVLKFEFESDQSYLLNLISELEAILVTFPVIGKP